MGKPLNLKSSKGCVATSSSCIIWQGKDIDCIEVCSGASIDEVIHEIGCMLCSIKDQLDVDTYDMTCFNLSACDIPHSFRELMQFLLDLSCQLQQAYLTGNVETRVAVKQAYLTGNVETRVAVNGIPSVTVASCFQGTLGNSALITDYIMAIGELVCSMQTTQINQQAAIVQMQQDIEILKG